LANVLHRLANVFGFAFTSPVLQKKIKKNYFFLVTFLSKKLKILFHIFYIISITFFRDGVMTERQKQSDPIGYPEGWYPSTSGHLRLYCTRSLIGQLRARTAIF